VAEHSRKPQAAGLIIVDKPSGMTSHDVVSRVRRTLHTRRVGHAGTLDPMATGVLVLGVERGTKLLGHLALETKAYLATIRLGATTTTDDADGETLSIVDASAVDEASVTAGIAELTGTIDQVPSAVSALKVNGRRAYELARSGESVELAARKVTVSRFDLLALRRSQTSTELDVLVECSSGTYVRALARDLGARLEVGGHLVALRRTRVGPFGLAVTRTLEQLDQEPELSLGMDSAIETAFPQSIVDSAAAGALAHGRPIPAAGIDGTYGVFGPDGSAVALVRDQGRIAKPVLVVTPAA
jgi:tRNA pseudouridine55 synthase